MKNLFDFATKELSQDAVICWLFDCYNSDNPLLKKASYNFINSLTGFDVGFGDIEGMIINQQEHKIDIAIEFWTIGKKENEELHYFVAIEDKTNSSAQNQQLERYKNILCSVLSKKHIDVRRTRLIFFKVDTLTDIDKKAIEKANALEPRMLQWIKRDVDDINNIFSKIDSGGSEILDSYKKHISDIYCDCHCSTRPEDNNVLKWKSFFEQEISPFIKNDSCNVNVKIYRNLYAMLTVSLKGRFCEETPYLEIRSRDCLNSYLSVRLLTYDKKIADQEKYRNVVKEKGSLFKQNNYKKQIASTGELLFSDDKVFKELIGKSVYEYVKITDCYLEHTKKLIK